MNIINYYLINKSFEFDRVILKISKLEGGTVNFLCNYSDC